MGRRGNRRGRAARRHPPAPELRAPGAATAALGAAVAVGALALARPLQSATDLARTCSSLSPAGTLGGWSTASWGWLPLGWTCEANGMTTSPSWWPTYAFAAGLGAIALGLALWVANRTRALSPHTVREPAA